MPEQLNLDELMAMAGRPVYGSNEELVGHIEEVYYDDDTGRPEWVRVAVHSDDKRMLIPLQSARIRRGDKNALHVAYTGDQVRRSPSLGRPRHISEQEERSLMAHYGVQARGERRQGVHLLVADGPPTTRSGQAGPPGEATGEGGKGRIADGLERVTEEVRQRVGRGRADEKAGAKRVEPKEPTLTEDIQRGQQEAQGLSQEFAALAKDLQGLVQQEMQIAKAEVGHQASLAAWATVWGVGAAILAFLTLTFLFTAVMYALAEAFDLWVSALITTGLLAVLAAVAGFLAYRRVKQISLVPERTVQSVKEDVEWARNQLTSNDR